MAAGLADWAWRQPVFSLSRPEYFVAIRPQHCDMKASVRLLVTAQTATPHAHLLPEWTSADLRQPHSVRSLGPTEAQGMA